MRGADTSTDNDQLSSASSICYDLAIIGRGLIGSAASRHAAKLLRRGRSGGGHAGKIVLIGPSEPDTAACADGCAAGSANHPKVYGAHYDEGRITRRTDPDPIWAELASRSVRRYGEIREDATTRCTAKQATKSMCTTTGTTSATSSVPSDDDAASLDFFVECGHLAVGPENSETIQRRKQTAASMGIVDCASLDENCLRDAFPYLHFPAGCVGLHEPRESGYISARRLVAAQTTAAQNMGVTVIDAVASQVERSSPDMDNKDDGKGVFTITTEPLIDCNCAGCVKVGIGKRRRIRAKKVLVAAGAFCNARPLLPVKLDLTPIKTQTVHFVLSDEDVDRLEGMPSIIFKDESMWSYLLPPIEYQDKTVRLKLGGARLGSDGGEYGPSREMSSNEEVMEWYQTDGSDSSRDEMVELLRGFIPNVNPVRIISNSCATLNTPTRQAYIGELSEGWGVATGGNGYAAKSSDELGRLAALSLLDKPKFDSEFICGKSVSDVFRPVPMSK